MAKKIYSDLSISEKLDLFYDKNSYLENTVDFNLEKIDLYGFYNLVFKRDDELPFQEKKDDGLDYSTGVYNSILVDIKGDKSKPWIITKDLDLLDDFIDSDFVITSPITYVGRNRNANNSRYIYGLAFDIDGVFMQNLRDILHQMKNNYIPTANIIVNSGNGVHLYYLFEKPIALYPNVKKLLQELKYGLTRRLWNRYTSSIKEEQVQGIFQGFRIPDTKTKLGTTVTAYEFKDKDYASVDYLNSFLSEFNEHKLSTEEIRTLVNAEYKQNKVSLSRAKELYPDWYERRIVKGEKRSKWNIKRDLYDWWLNKISGDENLVKEGHRYFCIMTLSMYAIKCNIPYEELEEDAYNLLEPMENISSSDDNHFTEEDIKDALRAYNDNYATFPRKDIEKITGIRIDKNKRNYRKQSEHIKVMNLMRDNITHPNGEWRKGNGRKSKEQIVAEWRHYNPQGRKADCIRETGLSKKTVYKHWESEYTKLFLTATDVEEEFLLAPVR